MKQTRYDENLAAFYQIIEPISLEINDAAKGGKIALQITLGKKRGRALLTCLAHIFGGLDQPVIFDIGQLAISWAPTARYLIFGPHWVKPPLHKYAADNVTLTLNANMAAELTITCQPHALTGKHSDPVDIVLGGCALSAAIPPGIKIALAPPQIARFIGCQR